MPSAYPEASAALEAQFMRFTLRATVASVAVSCPCGIRTTTTTVERRVDGRDQAVAVHLISIPIGTAFSLATDTMVTIDGKGRYQIIGPYESNLELIRRYQAVEVR